jgi:hypothetical protein
MSFCRRGLSVEVNICGLLTGKILYYTVLMKEGTERSCMKGGL